MGNTGSVKILTRKRRRFRGYGRAINRCRETVIIVLGDIFRFIVCRARRNAVFLASFWYPLPIVALWDFANIDSTMAPAQTLSTFHRHRERHVVIKGWQAREFVKSMEKKISFLVSSSSLRSIGNKSIGFVARFQIKIKKKERIKKMERCYIWEAKWLSLGVCVWMNVNASAYLRGKGCGA